MLRLTPQSRLGGGNRVLRQLQSRGKIIPATGWQNSQNNISSVRCVRQSLKRTVAAKGKHEPHTTIYRGKCMRLEVFSISNKNKFGGNGC